MGLLLSGTLRTTLVFTVTDGRGGPLALWEAQKGNRAATGLASGRMGEGGHPMSEQAVNIRARCPGNPKP